MIEANPNSLVLYPGIAMARFGQIPAQFGGGNKYRVIWAPSRQVTLVGRGQTMSCRLYGAGPHGIPQSIEVMNARLSPAHEKGEVWILEVWKTPWDLYPGTKEQWEVDPKMLNMGPYPAKGDYCLSEPFYGFAPSVGSVEKMILQVEDGWKNRRPIENQIAIRERAEKATANRKQTRREIIRNGLLPFSGEAYSSGHGAGRGTKTIKMDLTTKDIGLPARSGATAAIRTKRRTVYQIPQEV